MNDRPLRVGVAGLGTVGSGLLRLLAAHGPDLAARIGRPIEVAGIAARSRDKDRGLDISGHAWFDDPVALAAADDLDIFVELIGGENGPAKAAIEAALGRGAGVVTANKALLARHGTHLARLAEEHGTVLAFEAAVGGGIPVVKALRESLIGNAIQRVYGILNGTCNYILTTMEEEGREFDEVLAEAQAKGYAEADPSFDIGGTDTAHKLALLASLAFGTEVDYDAVYVEGVADIRAGDIQAADDLGYRIKLLGVAQRTESGIEQRVHPTLVRKGSAIAEVGGVFNAVLAEGDFVGEVMLFGRGAGAGPTASAVAADIVDIARGRATPAFGRPASELAPYRRAGMRAHAGGYFVRLSVYDRPGAMAAIATSMAEENISLKSISQRERDARAKGAPPEAAPPASVTLITHETTEAAVRTALEEIERGGHILGQARMIRIEPT